MKVNEIFYSLQGEGARAGQASIFIRLTGCNLTCSFCDTEFTSGEEMTLDEILDEIRQYPTHWITWTGGEPALQLTQEVVDFFNKHSYLQSIETNGSMIIPDRLDWVVVSPKVAEHIVAKNFKNGVDELRYAWHKGKKSVPETSVVAGHKYLSPIFGGDNLNHCIELCLKNPEWKLSVQQHKLWNIQ